MVCAHCCQKGHCTVQNEPKHQVKGRRHYFFLVQRDVLEFKPHYHIYFYSIWFFWFLQCGHLKCTLRMHLTVYTGELTNLFMLGLTSFSTYTSLAPLSKFGDVLTHLGFLMGSLFLWHDTSICTLIQESHVKCAEGNTAEHPCQEVLRSCGTRALFTRRQGDGCIYWK